MLGIEIPDEYQNCMRLSHIPIEIFFDLQWFVFSVAMLVLTVTITLMLYRKCKEEEEEKDVN